MNIKRIIRLLAKSFALCFFIGDIYVAAYIQASSSGQKPFELLWLVWLFTFLMGVLILACGVLTDYDEQRPKMRRSIIFLGLFLSLGSLVAVLFVVPLVTASGY